MQPQFEQLYICMFFMIFADVIKQKGLENVTVDDLVAEITPKGRGKAFLWKLLLLKLFRVFLDKLSSLVDRYQMNLYFFNKVTGQTAKPRCKELLRVLLCDSSCTKWKVVHNLLMLEKHKFSPGWLDSLWFHMPSLCITCRCTLCMCNAKDLHALDVHVILQYTLATL